MIIDIAVPSKVVEENFYCPFCGEKFGSTKCGVVVGHPQNDKGEQDSTLCKLSVFEKCRKSETLLEVYAIKLKEQQIKLCTCDMTLLMRQGCTCGGE